MRPPPPPPPPPRRTSTAAATPSDARRSHNHFQAVPPPPVRASLQPPQQQGQSKPKPQPQQSTRPLPPPPPPRGTATREIRGENSRGVGHNRPPSNPSYTYDAATATATATMNSKPSEPYGEVSAIPTVSSIPTQSTTHRRFVTANANTNTNAKSTLASATTTASYAVTNNYDNNDQNHRRYGNNIDTNVARNVGYNPYAYNTSATSNVNVYQNTTPSSYAKSLPPTVSHTRPSESKVHTNHTHTSNSNKNDDHYAYVYQHNTAALFFLIPTLLSILWWHESLFILQTLLFLGLILYGLDLMNARDALTIMSWVSAVIVTMASGFGTLLQVDDAEASGSAMILHLLQLAVEGLFFCTLTCWFNLQFAWLHRDVPSIAKTMEETLHSLLPPISAAILSYHTGRLLMDYWGVDRVARTLPHLFAFLLTISMVILNGETLSSFVSSSEANDTIKSTPTIISRQNANLHTAVLLLVPGMMHLCTFQQRILSPKAGLDDLYDLILVWTVPYLLHCGILFSTASSLSPYGGAISKIFPDVREKTLRGSMVPISVSLLTSIAAQQRYIIPLCNHVSYQFNGHNVPSPWVISTHLTLSTCSILLAIWTYGRKSSVTGDLLFGEYHDDVVQLSVSASGLFVGLALGMPWNLTPLPILAFLGLSVWVTTRMLRYLCIFLFVIHAGSVVLFSYRFASIAITIPLAIPGVHVDLIRFGTIEVFSSVLIALVAGFAVRPPGGVGATFMKRVDVPGLLLILYQMVLIVLEITLLKRPIPVESREQALDVRVEDTGFLYDHATALLTSVTILMITAFSQRLKIISKLSSIIAMSLSLAKALMIMIDANEVDGKIRSDIQEERLGERLLYRTIVASFLLIVMLAPRAVLEPIHLKTSNRHKRSLADGRPVVSIPNAAIRNIIMYTMVILPASLLSAVPMVLTPLIRAFSAHYGGGAYYKAAPPISEMTGLALTLWGLASLFMINHYLPDGGAERCKKVAALTLVMGIGVSFSAPTIPEWIVGDNGTGVSNPYAGISSLGNAMTDQGIRGSAGWGILASSLATLLAVTGPLELRERRHSSGRKDQFFLFRLMVFSLVFGSGVSWFVTVQSMSQEGLFELITTGMACMVVSFFATVTCVLAYFLELENFDEVDQMVKICVTTFVLFGIVTFGVSLIITSSSLHAFGAGGWLATYLGITSLASFSLTMALKFRATKNIATRGLGNASCVLSYLCAILLIYGRFGVSGMDGTFTVTMIFGLSASILGTFLTAPILLCLEGETGHDRRSRVSKISAGSSRPTKSFFNLTVQNLGESNQYAPLVGATFGIFFVASLYVILIRGCLSLGSSNTVSNSQEQGSDALAKLAQQTISHSLSLDVSTRLAESGFWTSSNPFGPLIHLGGLIATIPVGMLVISQLWTGKKVVRSQLFIALIVNLIPLCLCRGIPSISAAAFIGTAGGIFQILNTHRGNRRSQMRM